MLDFPVPESLSGEADGGTGFSKLIDRDVILARIVPCVQAIASDSSQHVRASLAQQISGLAPLLGKESTIDVLVPLYLQLLKDDFSEVRLNLISKLEVVNNGQSFHLSLTSLPYVVVYRC